jgi:hypothetical protein
MNFREYFRTKIPGLYFIEGSWLEKLKEILLMPSDIFMQVLDYIPRLRDLKNKNAPEDGKILEGKMRNLDKYNEPDFNSRLIDSWTIWTESGSRYGLNKLITRVGYTLSEVLIVGVDTFSIPYGILDNIANQGETAYWATSNNISINRAIAFGNFYWGGFIDARFSYSIIIIDEQEIIYNNITKENELISICSKFAPAHVKLNSIIYTDSSGNILNTKYIN